MSLHLRVVPLLLLAGCTSMRSSRGGDGDSSEGMASYYSDSLAGHRTANGERYDPNAATCAHRTFPFDTWLEVVSVDTRARARCRVNDRGPYGKGRIVDVSRAVAVQLHMLESGVVRVRIRRVAR
jgi:rare lipoprotein A